MIRLILSVLLGVVVWFAIATIVNLPLRFASPEYAAVEASMAFSLWMLLLRLAFGVVSSIGAGLVTSIVSRSRPAAAWSLSAVLLLLFIPVHIRLWDRFPAWYHAFFLASLVVVPPLAASMWRRVGSKAAVPA